MDSLKSARGSVFGGRRATNKRRFLVSVGFCVCLWPLGLTPAQETSKPPVGPLTPGEFTAELNGLKLWFKVSGTGPVCLMPNPAWGPSSDPYFRTLQPLEKIFTLVYLDCRGTGRSQKAPSTKEYTWDHLVADLDALRVHLRQEKVYLMGHSEGGTLILHYACRRRERVNGLILLDATGVADELGNKDRATRVQRRKDQPWFAEAVKMMHHGSGSEEEMKAALQTMMPLYWADPAKIAKYGADFEATSMSVVAQRGQGDSQRWRFDLRDQLPQVKAPALIVVGSDDFVCSPFHAQRLHLGLPNSKLLLIENAGHFPWLEQPEAFFSDVPAFLKALNMPAGPPFEKTEP